MTNQVSVSELNMDEIKKNLRLFFSNQSEFTDYNFEGSGLSVLIDVLAYNTHYNALYQNLTFNEIFIDSAYKRNSVVSIARGLSYTPRSAIAPKAVVDVKFSNLSSGAQDIGVLPAGSSWSTTIDGVSYTFLTTQSYTTVKGIDNSYTFTGVEIYQGTQQKNSYLVGPDTRFLIQNSGADISTLKVTVQANPSTNTYSVYKSVKNVVDTSREAEVYYINELSDGMFEVVFGQDIIGQQPANGALVILTYLTTNASITNGAFVFSYSGETIGGSSNVSTTVTSSAAGGADPEDIESIRVNAINTFGAQNRLVNYNDYKSYIMNNFYGIDDVSVWGGEDNIPKMFGQVFLSIKPSGRDSISFQEETSITNQIKPKMVVGITPSYTDPESLSIGVITNVYYDDKKTNLSEESLKYLVLQAIDDYNVTNLNKFSSKFRYSKLTGAIDNADKSITNNNTEVLLYKTYVPTTDVYLNDRLNAYNGIENVFSSDFYVEGYENLVYLRDNGEYMSLYDSSTLALVQEDAGEKRDDYFTLKNFKVFNLPKNELEFQMTPTLNDVVSAQNQFIAIDLSKCTVNIIRETD